MKNFALLSAAALIALASPAQAQILGGVGGVLGGGGAGSGSSSIGGPLGSFPRVDTSTIGSATGSGEARASKKVDRRSGKVDAAGSANGQGNGSLTQTIDGPLGTTTGNGSAQGNAAGSGNAEAQLIGTDGVRSALGGARDKAGSAVGTTRDRTGNLVQTARGQADGTLAGSGNAAGSATGSGSGMASGGNGALALAGSAAVEGTGAFEVKRGTTLFDANGEKLGKVREVVSDGRGRVQALVVKVDGETAKLPASAFSTDGSVLLTGMTEGQIKSAAQQQEKAEETPAAPAEKTDAPAEKQN